MIEIALEAESRAAGVRLRRLAAHLTPPKVLALGFAGVLLEEIGVAPR